MEGIRVTTMLSHDMHSRLEEVAKKEFSNKNVLLRQAVALFLKKKVSIDKFKAFKAAGRKGEEKATKAGILINQTGGVWDEKIKNSDR